MIPAIPLYIVLTSALARLTAAAPKSSNSEPLAAQHVLSSPLAAPRPLVIWHGLGDSAHADGITEFINDIKKVHPGIFVYSVSIPKDGSADEERKAGFFGKAEEQAQDGCDQLAAIPELRGGFDAMGFSQGGLFLRSYVQNCNNPPVRNLMTFGTPHYGISALLPCPTPPSIQCLLAARAARAGIYSTYAQNHLIQAQYYRDVERLDTYREVNTFLTGLNHEVDNDLARARAGVSNSDKDQSSGDLRSLENFTAIMFDADQTVSPAQSAHFWTYAPGNKTVLLPLRDQPLYTQDWIGLRELDESGRLHLEHCPGEHMDLDSGDCARKVVQRWVGGE